MQNMYSWSTFHKPKKSARRLNKFNKIDLITETLNKHIRTSSKCDSEIEELKKCRER